MTPSEHARGAAPFSSSARILIVDDETYVRDVLSRMLSAEGYECDTAPDADEALRLLERDSYSLMVSDIMMPGKSGIELLTTARERHSDVAVVMITAVGDRETAIRALRLGAYAYVIKPFDHNEIIINVANALERRRLVLASKAYENGLEEKVREQTQAIRVSREEIAMRVMAAQEFRHDETGAHVRRIGLYAEIIGKKMGLVREYAEMLRLAAPMHDVGKIGVPDAILLKPGKLTEEEFETIKTHTTIGGEILEGSSILLINVARDIALYHHEKWDGSGYPQGRSGEHIPQTARIVAVVDVYDALVHDRVYRPAMSEEDALEIMSDGKGSHFDPDVFDSFLEVLPQLRRHSRVNKDRRRDVRRSLTGTAVDIELKT